MISYLLRRCAGAVPTFFIIVTGAFFLMRAAPGGPFDRDQAVPPDILANLDAAYGLDRPVWVQYGRFLVALVHGDLGPSFRYKDFAVSELLGLGFPVSAELGGLALILALGVGIPVGMFAALRQGSIADSAAMTLAVLGIAVPSFVVLPFLGLVFGIHLGWLPVAGWEPRSPSHLVLPVIALALPPLAAIARLTRGNLIEVLRQPYIRTAVAKGLPLHSILLRHALRPTLMPVASFLPPAVAAILTGSLVVESIAGLPGIGRYLVQGALNRDYTLVMGMVIIYSGLLIGVGLLVDLAYAWLDPRIRWGR